MATYVLPSRVSSFLVAEHIRQEVSGKATVIGLSYGDLVLPAGTQFPVAMSIAFLWVFADGEGDFKPQITLVDPKGNSMGVFALDAPPKRKDSPMMLIASLPLMTVLYDGEYKVSAILSGREYQESFRIKIGT